MTPHGPAIRAFRQIRGLSLRGFARLIDKDPGYWSRVETGQQGAAAETLHDAATVLDVPVEAITKETPSEHQEHDHSPH